jgi:GAF domain-containing protein/anti-sigma regulatory factor (Ser/Thr protein kinase)
VRAHLRVLLDGLEEEAVILERTGQIAYANAAWLCRQGLSLEQVVGHRPADLPSLAQASLPNLDLAEQTWSSGEPVHLDVGGWEIVSSPAAEMNGQRGQVVQIRWPYRGKATLDATPPRLSTLSRYQIPLPALDDLRDAVRPYLHSLVQAWEGAAATIHRLDPGEEVLVLLAHSGLCEREAQELTRWSLDEAWLAPVLAGETTAVSRTDDEEWPEALREFQAAILIPLPGAGELLGMLCLLGREPHLPELPIPPARASRPLALLLWQARILSHIQPVRRLAALYSDILSLVGSSADLDELLHRLVERCTTFLGAAGGVILLREVENDQLVLRPKSAFGIDQRELRPLRIPLESEELSAQVFRSGEPFGSSALAEDPRLKQQSFLPPSIGHLLAVPLCTLDRTIGVLHLFDKETGGFTQEDVQLMMGIVPHLASVIENVRLLREAQVRREVADVLQEVAQVIGSPLTREELLDMLLQQLSRVIEYDRAVIALVDESGVQLAAGRGFASDYRLDRPPARLVLDAQVERMRQYRRPFVMAGVQQDDGWVPLEGGGQIHSCVCAPILFQDRMVGSLYVDKGEWGYYRQEHAELLYAFANQVGIVIENTRLLEEERERAAQLRLISAMGQRLLTILNRDELLAYAMQAICDLLQYDHAEVYLVESFLRATSKVDGPGEHVVFQAGSGLDQDARHRLRNVRYRIGEEGIIGHVAATGESYFSMDVERDPFFLPNPLLPSIGSELAVPIKIAGSVVGVLDLSSEGRAAFDQTDLVVMQTVADQLALGLENVRLFEAERQRRLELESIQATATAISAELDRVSLLDKVASAAAEAFRAEATSLMLKDESGQSLVIRASFGLSEAYVKQQRIPIQSLSEGYDVGTGWQSMIVSGLADRPFGDRDLVVGEGIDSVLSVPLLVQSELIGALNIYSKGHERRFSAAEMELAEAFAAQASIAIHNATLYEAIQSYAQELGARADRLALIARISSAVNSLDLNQILATAEQEMAEAFDVEQAQVLLLDHPADDAPSLPSARALAWMQSHKRPLPMAASEDAPGHSMLLVPLVVRDDLIGLIRLRSGRVEGHERVPDADEQSLAQTIANQVAMAIANAQLFSQAEQRVRELTAFSEVSRLLAHAGDLQAVLDIVLDYVLSRVGCQEGSVILIDPPDGDTLRIVNSRGLPPDVVDEFNTRPVYAWQGTYRRALETGQIVEVADTAQDPDFLHDVGSVARPVTNVPLRVETGPIGLIAVNGLPANDNVRRLLLGMADMAAVAIERARLYERTEHQLAEVYTLYTLADQLTRNLSIDSVLETIVTVLKMTLNCRASCIFLLDESKQVLKLAASCGVAPPWDHVAQLRVGEGISGRVISTQQPYYVADTREDPSFLYFNPDIRSLLVVPLVVRGRAIGTLSIDDLKPHAFGEETHLLSIAAAQASVAIENAQLFESMEQKARQLREAYESLKELDQLKGEFVQNISHELRTPLTFIRGYVELLLEGVMGPLEEEQRSALDVVTEKTRGLVRLVEDIMALQQPSGVGFQPEPVSLVELGRAALKGAFAGANAVGLTLVDEIPDDLVLVKGDPRRLGQVLDNLLSNAIKFTPQGGRITLRMRSEPEAVLIEVEDTGMGIREDQLDRVFDRFYQVDGSPTRRYGGTGLGLAIVKQFVEQHGGTVGVRSQPGQGSTFYFTLPRCPELEDGR